ncbi:hypothetical protein I215_06512 [Galbibacter marinus]|uniref:Uncharacterized protein n=1 Tax=Galbibacter marinus TaxID=555500 RepID=K2Q414_9FLAO|nr:hypothetical protein [Galbibacter marinus]EKF55591.1 hypothetical protein I215_06512 [Galbibacter marinus]
MCEISDQIKFCTCTDKSIEELEDYWVLYRLKEPGEYTTDVIGMVIPRHCTNNKTKEINIELLLKLLNSNSIFDKPISIIKDDILYIHFLNPIGYTSIEYQFKFTGKAWENLPLNDIAIFMNRKESSGKVQNGIKPK